MQKEIKVPCFFLHLAPKQDLKKHNIKFRTYMSTYHSNFKIAFSNVFFNRKQNCDNLLKCNRKVRIKVDQETSNSNSRFVPSAYGWYS